MFEVTNSGSGSSTSSDSIVNISHSGASSISASQSPTTTHNNNNDLTISISTTTTTTTTTSEDQLKQEVSKLLEEKKILEGRIRGYLTLSDLLVDCRKENEQLKGQLRALTMALQNSSSAADRLMTNSCPFSLVSSQAAQQRQGGSITPQSDASLLALQQDQKDPPFVPLPRHMLALEPTGPPVAHPPVIGPSSLQETVGPPGDSKETTLALDPKPASSEPAKESTPKQESLEPGSEQQHLGASGSPSLDKVQHNELSASVSSSPELLQLDSDKYDEATYEKVGLQLAMGHAGGMTGSMYATAGSGSGQRESRATDFPSLSSELSNSGMAQPPSRGSAASNPPFMAMMHQSLTGLTLNKPGSDLATEVEHITERLHSEPGDSMPAIALQMHQIAERITQVEQNKRDQRKLIDALMGENQELKRQMKDNDNTLKAQIIALREKNMRLMQQMKSSGREEQSMTVKSSGAHGDWVHVEKPPHMGETPTESDRSFVGRIRMLEHDKAELMRANSNWKNQWDQLERSHQAKVNDMHTKIMLLEQELAVFKSRLAEQMSEFEGRMLEMKRRIGEEENLKEEVQHQQRLAERRCSELQDQLTELRTQLSDTAREKQALSTELNILKARTTGQEMQTSGTADASNVASRSALEAEIAMLKEQLKVFAEDFEQERMDRTTAQSARDTAKKNTEAIARQTQSLSSQVRHLQKQIKDRDDTISWTLRQNETLQRQAADYKKKLAGEWEEKQSLHRRVLLLEQRLQQQQPPTRNPYLSAEPTTSTTFAQIPVHQPPPPPPPQPTVTNFGALAGGSGSSRGRPAPAAGGVLSPEHLPGAWTCAACTYINYPGRTVCESCGLVNTPSMRAYGNPQDQFGYASHDMYGSDHHAMLMSRGADQNQRGMMSTSNSGDLVVDTGPV